MDSLLEEARKRMRLETGLQRVDAHNNNEMPQPHTPLQVGSMRYVAITASMPTLDATKKTLSLSLYPTMVLPRMTQI
jgi:hypothetical protein